MQVLYNEEIKELAEKANYIKSHHDSIQWLPSNPDCVYQLKSAMTYSKNDAKNNLSKILENESHVNHPAFLVCESRLGENQWRIVINLERLEKWH